MSDRLQRQRGRPAVELLEEAVTLLRRTPLSIYFSFFLGSVPFWLGFLFFLGDMSRSAFAGEHVLEASLSLALLYVWKKCWHAVACGQWRAQLLAEPSPPWSAARVLRLIAAQAALQPWGLVLRPLGYLATLPMVWVAAFYQNAAVLGEWPGDGRSVRARAVEQARLWPLQAHVLYGQLFVFSSLVWMNVATLLAALPSLLKTLSGVETMASRSPAIWVFNGTFPAVTLVLTILCVEPIWKAVFVLRCFYGESIRSGADLQVRLKGVSPVAGAVLAAFLLALSPTASPAAMTERPTAPAAAPAQLNKEIGRVLERREYAWRLPRLNRPEEPKPASPFMERLAKKLSASWHAAVRPVARLLKWLLGKLAPTERPGVPSPGRAPFPMESLLWVLLAVLLVVLAFAAWRAWARRLPAILEVKAAPPDPDLQADDVLADRLPEDGWLRLTREMMERGEYRLALRAAYLGGLAHLGERGLLVIARHKSNRDYWREVGRRAKTREQLLAAFADNLRAFERGWYGNAAVSAEEVTQFTANLERIRTC